MDKFLADTGFGTRSEVKKKLRTEKICVDGIRVRDAAFRFDPDVSRVTVNGEIAVYSRFSYYMLNKPKGVVSASRDPAARTVIDLIPDGRRRDLFPVGRLDKDTEGLLIITNDGQLSHRLLSPKHHVEKTYLVTYRMLPKSDGTAVEEADDVLEKTDGTPDKAAGSAPDIEMGITSETDEDREHDKGESAGILPRKAREMLESGVDIGDDKPTLPAQLTLPVPEVILGRYAGLFRDEASEEKIAAKTCLLIITEGRYHQVKRMFAAVGAEVTALARLSMGSLCLDPALAPGESRPLTEEEIHSLLPFD